MIIVKQYNNDVTISNIEISSNKIAIKKINQFKSIDDANQFIKNTSNVYLLSYNIEYASEYITLPSVVKNEKQIISSLASKVRGINKSTDQYFVSILNKKESAFNENEVEYKIDCVPTKSINDAMQQYKSVVFSKVISPQMAIFSMVKHFKKDGTFLFMFVSNQINYYLLIEDGFFSFYRSSTFEQSSSKDDNLSDISQTISYIKQTFRDISFKDIFVIDNFIDEEHSLSTFIKNIYSDYSINEFSDFPINTTNTNFILSNYFVDICAAYATEKTSYVPYAFKKYKYIDNLLNVVMFFSLIYVFYNFYYMSENKKMLDSLSLIQEQKSITLLKEARKINSLPDDISTYAFNNIKTSFAHQGRFYDLYSLSNQIISNIKPTAMDYSEKNNMSVLTIYFERKFDTLQDFSAFDKTIQKAMSNFVSPSSYELKMIKKSDYAKLEYKATVSIFYHFVAEKDK